MSEDALRLSAACPGGSAPGPECWYEGETLPVRLTLANAGAGPLSLPLAFLRKAGPVARVVDRRTRTEIYAKRNLADHALLDELVALPPGAEATLDWMLAPVELEAFGLPVDVAVEFTVQVEGRVGDRPATLRAQDVLRVIARPRDAEPPRR